MNSKYEITMYQKWALILIIAMVSCKSSIRTLEIENEIKNLYRENIEAHLKKDVEFLCKNYSSSYFSVKDGEISFPEHKEIVNSFTSYLNSTSFLEYKELEEPIVGYSDDGSLIWVVAKVKVSGIRKNEDGSEREVDFTCAWLSIFKRNGKELIRLGDVSTFK